MKFIYLILSVCLLVSCVKNSDADSEKHRSNLKSIASKINQDFKNIRMEVKTLADELTKLYENQADALKKSDPTKYALANNGVFFKTEDDGGAAVFVSGVIPINEEIKKVVYFTEPLDSSLKRISKKYPEAVQAYYNDKHSVNRIYPFFDVLAQYEAKMDIPAYNFYFCADLKHNPSKQAIWVNEPYVDPAGRGWMVSAIAPVYYKDELVGVPGIDVTINTITRRYLLENSNIVAMIVDTTGVIVAAQESMINLLSFPTLIDHKYIETIKQNTYRKEAYNIKLSREVEIRKLAKLIINDKSKSAEITLNGEKINFISEYIPELNWFLIEAIK
jgi:hypothetical protein